MGLGLLLCIFWGFRLWDCVKMTMVTRITPAAAGAAAASALNT